MKLYSIERDNAKYNAQLNLQGRTHYVDDATLRWHKSRILRTVVTDNGLLFALVESMALDMNNTKRGFRPVIFDIFGTVVEREKLADSFSTRKAAEKAMWATLNRLDAMAITMEGIDRCERNYASEIADLRATVAKIAATGKAA